MERRTLLDSPTGVSPRIPLESEPAENHTVICVDLRAYGRGIGCRDEHTRLSNLLLIGHDRGGRVCYQMALDQWWPARQLAAMGSAGARTGDKGRALLP
jgi:pimeloyl-ACP methyl ester carboxylesterase